MQAVLLAAGKGTRLRPITNKTPKPLVEICNQPLLEYGLKSLPDNISEVIIVVNYLKEQIIDFFGDNYNGLPIKYVIQNPLTGTAGALILAKDLLKGRFLVMNADDIYIKNDLENLVAHDLGALVVETMRPISASALEDKEGRFVGIEYNAPKDEQKLQVCGAYVLDNRFFKYPLVEIQVGKYTEFGLPQTMVGMTKNCDIKLVKASFWQPVGTQEELAAAKMVICGA